MAIKYTKEQINKKFKGYYIKFIQTRDYEKKIDLYEVQAKYKTIKESTTLGEDVGTALEYRR